MKLVLDRYAHLESPIHRWRQDYKLVGLFCLILAFAFINKIVLLPVILAVSSFIFIISNLPLSFLISRLRYPGVFILAMIAILPFFAGETVLWDLGWITVREEGCWQAILILIRFFCILTVSLVLFGTASFFKTIKSMQALGLSPIIVDMALLVYRYLEELGTMLVRMQRAIRLRGFQAQSLNFRQLKIFAQLTGTILIRSYERSLRIYQAMILRGYGFQNKSPKFNRQKIKVNRDYYSLSLTSITILIALSLVIVEIKLSSV